MILITVWHVGTIVALIKIVRKRGFHGGFGAVFQQPTGQPKTASEQPTNSQPKQPTDSQRTANKQPTKNSRLTADRENRLQNSLSNSLSKINNFRIDGAFAMLLLLCGAQRVPL